MSEYPPIPGVKLGNHERIIDHGTLLGYEWWVTLCQRENTEKFIADFLIPDTNPAARAYRLGLPRNIIDRALNIPYSDDMPHIVDELPGRFRITLSSYHIRNKVRDCHSMVIGHMWSLILGYDQADTTENAVWCDQLQRAVHDRNDAEKRLEQLIHTTDY